MIDNARLFAFYAFDDVVRKKAYSNLTIKQHTQNLDKRDKAFANALFYGALEKLITLDFILEKYMKSNPKPVIKNILRLGVYQMYFMYVPDHAAVKTSGELAQKLGKKGAAGFINGVLRSAAKDKSSFLIPDELDEIKKLSVTYSFPEWIVRLWIKELGRDEAIKLISYKKDNLISLYPNSLKNMTVGMLESELTQKKIEYKNSGLLNDVIRTTGDVFDTDLFDSGKVAVQGEASHLAAKVAVENAPKTVLDTCAAPGGKTAAMAHFNPEASYTACDISENKAEIMQKQFQRLGVKAEVLCADAAGDMSGLGEYDTVLVDAPCSALGTVFNHPEVRYNKTPEDIAQIAKTQKAILKNAAKHVANGGRLVYSTCTISDRENRDMVKDFLNNNPGFKPVFPKTFYGIIDDNRFDGYGVTLLPHIDATTGFYIACLEKCNG